RGSHGRRRRACPRRLRGSGRDPREARSHGADLIGSLRPPRSLFSAAEARKIHTDSMNVKRTQAERSESTRGALIVAARELFAEHGYAGVGTEEIVRSAGVTRGA